MQTDHRKPILELMSEFFPKTHSEVIKKDLITPFLFSPFTIELPQYVSDEIADFVKSIYETKENHSFQESLPKEPPFNSWPSNPSLLTCFDFHYSQVYGLKLIEINTNASLYFPFVLQNASRNSEDPRPRLESLFESFQQTFPQLSTQGITIFDENPSSEGLYFEFLLYKEWLESKSIKVNILSSDDDWNSSYKNVYNRHTDFYFESAHNSQRYEAYKNKKQIFSPHPREYFLLADKQRLPQYKKTLESTSLKKSQIIPSSQDFLDFTDLESLWSQRKKFFFKPKQSFGSKGAFSGKSISRKRFDELNHSEFLAQELFPAPKKSFEQEGSPLELKFDLRFFTFEGSVINYGARLYQGQATNMKTPSGGLAPIVWV